MLVAITCHGLDEYGVTVESESQSYLMRVGESRFTETSHIEIFEFMGIHGIEVKTPEGTFSKDIHGSGLQKLYKVENEFGDVLSI